MTASEASRIDARLERMESKIDEVLETAASHSPRIEALQVEVERLDHLQDRLNRMAGALGLVAVLAPVGAIIASRSF